MHIYFKDSPWHRGSYRRQGRHTLGCDTIPPVASSSLPSMGNVCVRLFSRLLLQEVLNNEEYDRLGQYVLIESERNESVN